MILLFCIIKSLIGTDITYTILGCVVKNVIYISILRISFSLYVTKSDKNSGHSALSDEISNNIFKITNNCKCMYQNSLEPQIFII